MKSALRFLQKLKFLRALIAAVKDPSRTEEIFNAIGGPEMSNVESLRPVQEAISQSEQCLQMVATRYFGNWSLEDLLQLPPESMGFAYANHMKTNGLVQNFYRAVKGDTDVVYIQNRVRHTHDVWHILTGFDTSLPGEAGLQAFVYAQLRGRSSILIIGIVCFTACCFNHNFFQRPWRPSPAGGRAASKPNLFLQRNLRSNGANP